MSSMDNGTNSGTQDPITQTMESFNFSDFDFSIPEFPPEETPHGNPSPGPAAPVSAHSIVPTLEPDRLTEVLTGRLRARAVRTLPIRRGPEARGLQPLYDNMGPEELERRRQHNLVQARENKRQQRERNNAAAKRSRERRVQLIEDQAREIQRLREENGALSRERDYWKRHFQATSATHPSLGLPNPLDGTTIRIGSTGHDSMPSAGPLGGAMPVDIRTAVPPQSGRSSGGGAGGANYVGPGAGVCTPGAAFPNDALTNPQNADISAGMDELFAFGPNADFSDFSFPIGSV